MNNKQRSSSNLKCNAAKFAEAQWKSEISLSKSGQTAVRSFGYFLFFLCLSCALPEGEVTLGNTQAKTLIENLSSNREREAPPILGIRYIETLGRTGQGAGEFSYPTRTRHRWSR